MATLKQLRIRLKSMHATRKITSAMKLVAASRWRRQQGAWKAMKEYITSLDAEMVQLIRPWIPLPCVQTSRILIVCTPHRGLCGGYPTQIKNAVMQATKDQAFDRILVLTDKGRSLLSGILPKLPTCEVVSHEYIGEHVTKWHTEGVHVSIVHGSSRQTIAQEAVMTPLIPYEWDEGKQNSDVVCEPSGEVLAPQVIEHALIMRWHYAWLESVVAEEAARMSAMDQATRNADDAIMLLKRTYNRMRQERITTELVEMISGSAFA